MLSDDQFTYVYDLNGNLISKTETATLATTTYNWDAQNQLTSIDFADLTSATYAYDALGRWIEKNVSSAVTAYVYDGEDILLEFDGLGALLARYSHGDNRDQPLAMERNGQTYFYHADHLGSIRLVTDSAGAVVNRYDYDAYGNFEIISEGITNPYTFTGREYDAESNLFYYRARYLDANTGRFISEDSLGFAAGDANLYRYVFNNPTNLTDPSGQIAPILIIGGGFLIGGGVGAGLDFGGQVANNLSNGNSAFSNIDGGSILTSGIVGGLGGAVGAGGLSIGANAAFGGLLNTALSLNNGNSGFDLAFSGILGFGFGAAGAIGGGASLAGAGGSFLRRVIAQTLADLGPNIIANLGNLLPPGFPGSLFPPGFPGSLFGGIGGNICPVPRV